MDYAKSYIAWVEPLDFLYATTTSDAGRAQIEKEAGELDLERLRRQTQPIHLTVDFETGKIVGHEGRHRIAVLELYSKERAYGSPKERSHVLITIYEKNSLPDYIEKTADKDRILHIKEGSQQMR